MLVFLYLQYRQTTLDEEETAPRPYEEGQGISTQPRSLTGSSTRFGGGQDQEQGGAAREGHHRILGQQGGVLETAGIDIGTFSGF